MGRQYTTHDDRLSDDGDDDDETSRSTHDITNEASKGHKGSGEDSDAQRAWNVPDDEWEWSDEEPASSSTHSKGSRVASAPSRSRHGNTLAVPSKGPTGLGLSTSGSDQHDSTGSRSSNASSRSSSAGASSLKRTPVPDSSASKPMERSTASHPLSVAQDLSISICDSGHYIACASKKMFAILQRQPSPVSSRSPTPNQHQERGSFHSNQEWVLVGQGSGLDSPLYVLFTLRFAGVQLKALYCNRETNDTTDLCHCTTATLSRQCCACHSTSRGPIEGRVSKWIAMHYRSYST